MDWEKAAEGQSETMSEGYHRVKIAKAMRAKKSGDEFVSRDGDPQICAVLENEQGEQAICMFTLTEKAGWVLARCLKACGRNLQKMNESGVTMGHFHDETRAKKWLEGLEGWVFIEHRTADSGRAYANVEWVCEEDVPADRLKRAPSPPGQPQTVVMLRSRKTTSRSEVNHARRHRHS